jgi:hypothetical protein
MKKTTIHAAIILLLSVCSSCGTVKYIPIESTKSIVETL